MRTRSNATARVLKEMLRQNTGWAMLDSGDYYGRNWQHNQTVDFDAQPASYLNARVYKGNELDLSVTHNVYPWLLERLTYDAAMDARFKRFASRGPRVDESSMQNVEDFGAQLAALNDATGIYGDGEPFVVNTYNGADCLSQVLQYLYFELNEQPYVLLQIHGGCDVRGGYTTPRAFTLDDELNILQNADAVLYPKIPATVQRAVQPTLPGLESAPEPPYWQTDDGYHWYQDGSSRSQLSNYPASENIVDRGKGITVVHDDKLYCPISGCELQIA